MNTSMPQREDQGAPSEAQREAARIWLSRLAGGDLTQAELQAFKRWQRAEPANASAFEDAKRKWRTAKPVLGELLRTDRRIAARHERLMQGPVMGRRAFLATAVSTAAVAGVVVAYPPLDLWPSPREWGADYVTATGEQRTLTLDERVGITLNTRTRVRQQVAQGRTIGLELLSGEAAIDLSSAGGAFHVVADAGRTRAEAGRFEVRYLAGRVCVTCIDGTLEIEHPAGSRQLRTGQQSVYDATGISGIARVDPEEISAWRRGELRFHETPLTRVLDEINRYRPGHVLLTATAKRGSPVSGRFRIAVLDEALLQIQHTFDLQATALTGGVLVLS